MFRTIQHFLWVFPAAMQALIGSVMVWRRMYHQLPWFLTYTIFHTLRAALLWEIHVSGLPLAYFWTYWIGEAISAALGFLVIYELYRNVLETYEALRKLGAFLFRWAALIVICLATLSAFSTTTQDLPVITAILTAERSIRIVQFGLLIFLFSFASFLKLTLRHYIFGIGAGFLIAAGTELAIVAIRAHGTSADDAAFALLNSASYNCAVAIWAAYILRPIPVSRQVFEVTRSPLADWNRALEELLAQ